MINGMHRIWTVVFFVAIVAALPVLAKKKDDKANLRSAYIRQGATSILESTYPANFGQPLEFGSATRGGSSRFQSHTPK